MFNGKALSLTLVFAAVMLICVVPATSMADLIPIGDPISGGSFGQEFQYNPNPSVEINSVFVSHVSGAVFEVPIFREFTVEGSPSEFWYNDVPQFSLAGRADGNLVAQLNFQLWFFEDIGEDMPATSFVMATFPAGDGTQDANETFTVIWDGTTWDVDSFNWDITPNEVDIILGHLPAPGAFLLGSLGLGMVGWLKRRLA